MGTEKNVEIVKEIYAAFGRGDIPAIMERLTTDVAWKVQSSSPAAWHQPVNGKADVVPKFFVPLAAEMEFPKFQPTSFIAADNRVFALVDCTGRGRRTGRELSTTLAHLFTLTPDGRVAGFTAFEDTWGIAKLVVE